MAEQRKTSINPPIRKRKGNEGPSSLWSTANMRGMRNDPFPRSCFPPESSCPVLCPWCYTVLDFTQLHLLEYQKLCLPCTTLPQLLPSCQIVQSQRFVYIDNITVSLQYKLGAPSTAVYFLIALYVIPNSYIFHQLQLPCFARHAKLFRFLSGSLSFSEPSSRAIPVLSIH